LVFFLGLTVGPLIVGAMRDRIGYGNTNDVVAVLSGGTAALSFWYMGGRLKLRSQNEREALKVPR
jgi:hypothetical protein